MGIVQKIFCRFLRNKSGNVGITFGLMLSPLLLLAGVGLDLGHAYNTKQRLQGAGDAAVLAAASLPADASIATRQAMAVSVFNNNLSGVSGVNVTITPTASQMNLTAKVDLTTSFLQVAQINTVSVQISASAEVADSSEHKFCLLALDPNATNGFKSQGTPNVAYSDCWAHTNATSVAAIDGGGSAAVSGAGHSAVGGVSASAMGVYSPAPTANASVVNDPFASVGAYVTPSSAYTPTFTPPAIPSTCKASNLNLKKGSFTLQPGRYCGGVSLQAGATVSLDPGVYIMDNGIFNVQSGASATGSNVLFYLSGADSSFRVIGGGSINLKGRQSGSSYAGFLIIAHPDAARGQTSNIQGGGAFTLEGMIYTPTQNILVTGNGDSNGSSAFFAMVAKSFEFRGNGVFNFKRHSASSNMPDIMPVANNRSVRLIN